MRRVIAAAVVLVCAFVVVRRSHVAPITPSRASSSSAPAAAPVPGPAAPAVATPDVAGDASIAHAFAAHARDVPVTGAGTVFRVLTDDRQGDRHQRFLVRLASGQTILITHNIDVAPRVPNLRIGDTIAFEGEYVWNAQGGLVHWTHHDPSGRHKAGRIEYAGRTYQ